MSDIAEKPPVPHKEKARPIKGKLDDALDDTFPASDPVSHSNPNVTHSPQSTGEKPPDVKNP